MSSNGTIMVVDDRAENRAALSCLLKNEGFDVAEAVNGKEALKKLKTLKPELILLDMEMPVMDGRTFMAIKKKITSIASIPVFVLSGREWLPLIAKTLKLKSEAIESMKILRRNPKPADYEIH